MALPCVAPAMCIMMKDAAHECDPKGQATPPVENSLNVHQDQVPLNDVSHNGVIIIFFLQISRHSQTPSICTLNSQGGALNVAWFIFQHDCHTGRDVAAQQIPLQNHLDGNYTI